MLIALKHQSHPFCFNVGFIFNDYLFITVLTTLEHNYFSLDGYCWSGIKTSSFPVKIR